jgi:hypothetical protein
VAEVDKDGEAPKVPCHNDSLVGNWVLDGDGKLYLMQVDGIPTSIVMQNGKTLRNVKPRGKERPIYNNVYLLTRQEAEQLFLETPPAPAATDLKVICTKMKPAGALRQIPIGVQKVAEEPQDADFEQAAVYRLTFSKVPSNELLSINYRGDVARLYAITRLADGSESGRRLVADNFYYGRPFLYGLWRLPEGATELELRILPLQENMPVYLPREADKTPGEQVNEIVIR